MKALTVRQPWAWAIATGRKCVENRSWPTNYRGPLLIHASVRFRDPSIYRHLFDVWPTHFDTGAIVARVELVACIKLAELLATVEFVDPRTHLPFAFAEGPWCWILQNAQPITPPIPCRGKLQLWIPPATVLQKMENPAASGDSPAESVS